MGFIAELKRRNVFRVGVAYLVLAWVVIQITDVAVPALRLPDWVPSLVFFLGIIGFPFILLFAWAFELTPEGIKREHQVDRSQSMTHSTGRKLDFAIIGLMAAALSLVVWDAYLSEPGEAPVEQRVEVRPLPSPELRGGGCERPSRGDRVVLLEGGCGGGQSRPVLAAASDSRALVGTATLRRLSRTEARGER